MKTPPKNLTDLLLSPASRPPASREEKVPFANQIARSNKRNLDRLCYWGRREIVDMLDVALRQYLNQFPKEVHPTPRSRHKNIL